MAPAPSQARRRRRPRPSAAFTLLEMLIAIAGLAVLGLALSTMVSAAGRAWASRADHLDQARDFRIFSARLHDWLRDAKRVAAVHTMGRGVDVMIWLNDDHQTGQVNIAELMLLHYNALDDTLDVVVGDIPDASLDNPAVNRPYAPDRVAAPSFATRFLQRDDVARYAIAERIESFTATPAATPGGPDFDYLELVIVTALDGAAPARLTAVAAKLRAPDAAVVFTEPADDVADDDGADDGDEGDERGDDEEDDDRDEEDEDEGEWEDDDDERQGDDDRDRGDDDDDDDDERAGRGRGPPDDDEDAGDDDHPGRGRGPPR